MAGSVASQEDEIPLGVYPWTPLLMLLGSGTVVLEMSSDAPLFYSPPESPTLASIVMAGGLALLLAGLWMISDRAGLWRNRPRGSGEWGVIPLTFGLLLVLYGRYLGRGISRPSLEFLFVEGAGCVAISCLGVVHDRAVIRRLPLPRWPLWVMWTYLSVSLLAMVFLFEALSVVVRFPWSRAGYLQSPLGAALGFVGVAGFLLSIPLVIVVTGAVHRMWPRSIS